MCAVRAEDGHFGAILQGKVGGLAAVAEDSEQGAEPLVLAEDALAGATFAVEVSAKAEVVRCQSAEFGPGSAAAGGFGLLAPVFQGGLDVAGEDLRQIVVAVELVLVVDAG